MQVKKVQESDFRGLTELNLSCPNVPGKPQIAYDFETTDRILTEVFAYFTNLLELNCHHILTLFTLTKRQLFSTSIRSSLSTVSTLSETAFI